MSQCEINPVGKELRTKKEIERSLIKTYRKETWTKFIKAIKDYELISNGDRIAVAISGGKDSILLAKLFQELKRHGNDNFELEFISLDPGFNDENYENMIKNCEYLGIPVKVTKRNLFQVVENISSEYPCYMCARMRRGALYEMARELGCNKVALGHHYDDVIETIMMNVLSSGTYMTMMPKLKAKNFEGMELIRPLYLVRETDIKRFSENTGLAFMDCGCVVTSKKTSSNRRKVKNLIKQLGTEFNNVEASIFGSASNVHVNAVIGTVEDGKRKSFLEEY